MKKRILAILLAVCLAAGFLPLSANAAALTGSREELKEFLYHFLYLQSYFDAEKASFSILGLDEDDAFRELILNPYQYNDSIYPGKDARVFYPYLLDDDYHATLNPNFTEDPLHKFSYTGFNDYYWKISEAKLDWIMENIYNISKEKIAKMKAEYAETASDYYYLHEGYHYLQGGGSGRGAPFGFSIAKINQKGNLTYVTCDTSDQQRAYIILELKTIDGSAYWTLHYATTAPVNEVPDLPEGFDYEAPVLPSGAVAGGTCGDSAAWGLNQNGLLTITGTGEVAGNFFFGYNASDVVIADGVNSIGAGAFQECRLSTITIPTSMTSIGESAFSSCDNLTDVYYSGTKEQWGKIAIGEYNEPLLSATIHFMGQSETPAPTGPVSQTGTAADGSVITITTWPDGKTSVKTQTPQGDTRLVVTTLTGAAVANVSIPGNPGPGKWFTDVQSGWYKDSVDRVTALGLFSGTGTNTFSPDTPMTRGMLATVLYRFSGEVGYGLGTGNFPDVKSGSWYKDAVDWAQATGVVTGTGNGFEPDRDITREQLVTMLYRYAQLIGVDSENSAYIGYFSDSWNVSDYAQKAMQWAVAEGFISGVGDNRLDPKGKATRAQVAVILTRLIDYLTGGTNSTKPADTPKVQNGYYICPVCKFVNEEGVACIACAYNYQQAKSEYICPTCGGGYDQGGVVPWVYCHYCGEYFSNTFDEPIFNCRRCYKGGLRPRDLDPESELCWDCYDPNPTYCTECGRSSNIVEMTSFGRCVECHYEEKYGYCEICGRTLTSIEANAYNGKRCYFCSKCDYCGGEITNEDFAKYGAFICSDCMSELNAPNVWCPNCGYGFHTTGVGIEGFYCSRCGHRWMP